MPATCPPALAPRRVRVTTRKAPDVAAGDYVALTARLLPPSHASLPGGYDFARDAYFAGIGAVGSTLGAVTAAAPPGDAPLALRFGAAIDHARNALAARVDTIIGGDEGAIAAAMVTGKRDFLSNDAKDLIREAGIFHIITISGVQMTLVAGIFFWTTRRLLALSPTLALRYPIKKWAAAIAIVGAIAYDVCTGSRVGTERALIMTLDRARRRHRRPPRADDAQSRPRGARRRRAGARGDPRRQLPAFLRRGRRAGGGARGASGARRKHRAIRSCRRRARPSAAA